MYCVRWYTSSPLPLLRPSTYLVHIRHPHQREKKYGFLPFWNSRLHDAFTFVLHIYYGRYECARSHFRTQMKPQENRERFFFFFFSVSRRCVMWGPLTCACEVKQTLFSISSKSWNFLACDFNHNSQYSLFVDEWKSTSSIQMSITINRIVSQIRIMMKLLSLYSSRIARVIKIDYISAYVSAEVSPYHTSYNMITIIAIEMTLAWWGSCPVREADWIVLDDLISMHGNV